MQAATLELQMSQSYRVPAEAGEADENVIAAANATAVAASPAEPCRRFSFSGFRIRIRRILHGAAGTAPEAEQVAGGMERITQDVPERTRGDARAGHPEMA
ncbi:hypothetical protein J7W19_19850 [Streptomyces mobaraensis NBRC 13819 = DSM 40847]|uniref:Uncharacterized protein n=1 Tax=Streptomyces mobaraensis (strain ATCC 29032 / DSM 40847 / JCM 4168 / NBRC 13819 / NCIMB 11159 / IPCR 16-22) TaxID=1223523 RepID=M3C7S9_STRM1|nr:hypothetical protein [Streptomyces mobaraensis]EMF00026.1 hypothetical protein H340_13651 [Streptomyces mobaraensis NBRC 13819 = DSM 40847]QTT75328.1 hypothetical protein J7W19_19850 [Streptomyces mobaraensis NBRC 13819 = DSM 40847]